ncbi:MAG: hypothetical protein LBH62_07095 [Nitrososphaerota archaeon]|nr:hypothetical protein [Nitrososphaerota archaeon]
MARKTKNTNVQKVYWLDESSSKCGMTRLYGRAFSYERVDDYVFDVCFERTFVVGVLSLKGVIAPMSFKGTLDGEVFEYYASQVLMPVMSAGGVLVFDDLSVYKMRGVLGPLVVEGVKIMFLPVYCLFLIL